MVYYYYYYMKLQLELLSDQHVLSSRRMSDASTHVYPPEAERGERGRKRWSRMMIRARQESRVNCHHACRYKLNPQIYSSPGWVHTLFDRPCLCITYAI